VERNLLGDSISYSEVILFLLSLRLLVGSVRGGCEKSAQSNVDTVWNVTFLSNHSRALASKIAVDPRKPRVLRIPAFSLPPQAELEVSFGLLSSPDSSPSFVKVQTSTLPPRLLTLGGNQTLFFDVDLQSNETTEKNYALDFSSSFDANLGFRGDKTAEDAITISVLIDKAESKCLDNSSLPDIPVLQEKQLNFNISQWLNCDFYATITANRCVDIKNKKSFGSHQKRTRRT